MIEVSVSYQVQLFQNRNYITNCKNFSKFSILIKNQNMKMEIIKLILGVSWICYGNKLLNFIHVLYN